MEIKTENNKVIFYLQDRNIDFDFGRLMVSQLTLQNVLMGEKTITKGKVSYEIATDDLVSMQEALEELSKEQIIKAIADIFMGIYKTEQQGLLKKEGIWLKFDNLYYDFNKDRICYAVLPVSEEIEFSDNLNWMQRLRESLNQILQVMDEENRDFLQRLLLNYFENRVDARGIVERLIDFSEGIDKTTLLDNRENKHLSLVYFEDGNIREYHVNKDEILIGKSVNNVDIAFVNAKAMSRIHCRILTQNHNYFIQDLDSVNHTLVNGEFVPPYELMELGDRDLLTLGDIEIRVSIE